MTDYVFVGPSLSSAYVRNALPEAIVLPPIAHLDLLKIDAGPGDRIGLIDGRFFQSEAVRHKELLWVLAQGASIFGASSMGALRAAELRGFGMVGIGHIFEAFTSGRLTRDDEVAITHLDAEHDFRPMSQALVDIRASLDRAVSFGACEGDIATRLVTIAQNMYFPDRSLRSALHTAVEDGIIDSCDASQLAGWLQRDNWSQKREDAKQLVEALRGTYKLGRTPRNSNAEAVPFGPRTYSWVRSCSNIHAGQSFVTEADVHDAHRLFSTGANPIPFDQRYTNDSVPSVIDWCAQAKNYNLALLLHNPSFRPDAIPRNKAVQLLESIWKSPADDVGARTRGFCDLEDAVKASRKFLPYYVQAGAPK